MDIQGISPRHFSRRPSIRPLAWAGQEVERRAAAESATAARLREEESEHETGWDRGIEGYRGKVGGWKAIGIGEDEYGDQMNTADWP